MKHPLKKALKDHLDAKCLTEDQREALMVLQRSYDKPAHTAKIPRYAWGVGAAVLLVVSISILWLSRFPAPEYLIDQIAAEVVDNHLHMKPLEVSTSRITRIQDYFKRLDFKPVQSRYLAELELSLLGGRYCSLQGITAAQLRYKSLAVNERHTLYQVGYDPVIFSKLPDYDRGEPPVSTWSKGVKVTLWVEKGVLFALTQESHNEETQPRDTSGEDR